MAARADETLRRVQEELRKRNVFFGEIDGRQTPEFTAALQHYQERKSFAPTGEPNAETLRSLDLAPMAATANKTTWPDVTVLKSDSAREEKNETPPPPVLEAEPAASPLDGAQVKEFLTTYLQDAATNNLSAEMSYYGDPLDYFDHGMVDLHFVERDVSRYYHRWPNRTYELLQSSAAPAIGHPENVVARFRIAFTVKNGKHSVIGETDNVFTLKSEGANYKIISMRERRVRGE